MRYHSTTRPTGRHHLSARSARQEVTTSRPASGGSHLPKTHHWRALLGGTTLLMVSPHVIMTRATISRPLGGSHLQERWRQRSHQWDTPRSDGTPLPARTFAVSDLHVPSAGSTDVPPRPVPCCDTADTMSPCINKHAHGSSLAQHRLSHPYKVMQMERLPQSIFVKTVGPLARSDPPGPFQEVSHLQNPPLRGSGTCSTTSRPTRRLLHPPPGAMAFFPKMVAV